MTTMPTTPAAPGPATRGRPLRVGFVALTDAAPFAVAQELGLFARHGVEVELRREIGWATIRDKIIYGELDAAHAPAPMLWSVQLGLGCPPCDALTALVLGLNGNAITLSRALWEAGVRDAASLGEHVRTRRAREPLTLGVVFPFSSHQLLLTDWLRSAGLDPAKDVRIVVVPPAQMFRNLAARTLDGFCAGEPWNSLAVREGAGWCPAWSAALQPGHVEKVLLVTRRFAETRATEHAALVRALAEAAAWCDEPQHRERLAELLAQAPYLNLPARVIAPALLGGFDCGHGRVEAVPDFHVFHRGEASVPAVEKARPLQRALGAAGLLPATAAKDPELPRRLFREDLHRTILSTHPHHHEIAPASDLRGVRSLSG
ncbi:MAG: CmpA/NrtA family ABC transporter substrate-binding protein [Opitutaceae bacterium]|nr:CmpA/NrtA family ABC transporter substrate-binding protein [Opitutaceae bacterium]